MCGILCFISPNNHDLNKFCSDINHRGPDHSNISSFRLGKDSSIHFIVTQLMIVGKEPFPILTPVSNQNILDKPNFLIGNIEIYNYNDIYDIYLKDEFQWEPDYSDAHILLPLLQKLKQKSLSITEAFEKTLNLIQGDYALAILLEQRYLLFARDPIGIRPLYYVFENRSSFAFASETRSLTELGYSFNQINAVKPGDYTILDLEETENLLPWYHLENNLPNLSQLRISLSNGKVKDSNSSTDYLLKLLLNSVSYHVPSNNFGLFLSGGIDSSLILGILLNLKKEKSFKAISVGFKDSSDVIYAQRLCEYTGIGLEKVIINTNDIENALKIIVPLLKTRNGKVNTVDISIALPIYFASKKSHELGYKVALSGQGADELFIGYNKYFEEDLIKNNKKLLDKVNKDLIYIATQNLERDDLVSMYWSIELRFPYLSMEVIKWVFSLNVNVLSKVNTTNRKELLRNVAAKLNLPDFIVTRQKKAAQYGTSIMKNLQLLAKPYNSVNDYLESFI